jgi:DeoR family transcriptional regulator, suf operon transcriptional repressor
MSSVDKLSDTEHTVDDRAIIEYLRRQGAATVHDLVEFAGVTATAVRQRLTRLLDQGLIVRESEAAGRGRPTHRYSLSAVGIRSSGTNYEDLVSVLWTEIRAVKDPDIRYGLLQRIVTRLAEIYREQIKGDSLKERMESLVELMRGRDIPFEVIQPVEGQLPVLKALACPYPSLAEQDRSVCSMEKMLFAEVLGSGLRLHDCRLDGYKHCTFEASSNVVASA